MSTRVAVTGASCRLPGAYNPDALWSLMTSQGHGLRQSPPGRYEALELTPKHIKALEEIGHDWGGYIDGPEMFDPTVFGMSRVEASVSDPQHRLLLEVVWEALENACEAPEQLAGTRTGVFVGLTSVDYAMFQGAFDTYGDHTTPFSAAGCVHSIAANRISYMLDLQGPSLAIDTACSSSSHALHMAMRSIEQGECDSAIVCGANMIMVPYVTKSFKRARMISPDGLVKCFDAKTNGYVRAEGAVAIVIRREEDAITHGNRIMSVISGSAINHDGRTPGLVSPSHERQTELIRAAHAAAGIEQQDIGFVEAHGTGTYRGDETELNALNDVFSGERTNPCYVGSLKANVGHLEAVSGLAGVLKATMCLEKGEIPGQANLTEPMPAATADGGRVVIPTETVAWPRHDVPGNLRRAGVSCLGFGGANSHVVVEARHAATETTRRNAVKRTLDCPPERSSHVLKLTAKTPAQIAELASNLGTALAEQPDFSIQDICHSANIGRADFEARAAIVASSRQELLLGLDALAQERTAENTRSGHRRRGTSKFAFLLRDQETVHHGIGRALYTCYPQFASTVDATDLALRGVSDLSLLDCLYGDTSRDGTPIKNDTHARVALFAIQFALLELFEDLGVTPTTLLTENLGTTVATVQCGEVSLADALISVLDDQSTVTGSNAVDQLDDQIKTAIEDGLDLIVDLGAAPTPAEKISSVFADFDGPVVSCLSTDADDMPEFGASLATLYTSGARIDWRAYDSPFERQRIALPTYPFSRERFWFTDAGKRPTVDQPPQTQDKTQASAAPSQAPKSAEKTDTVSATPTRLNRQELFDRVRQDLVTSTPLSLDDIDEKTVFTDIELESIAALELLLRMERMIGVMPDPDLFAEDMTFGTMIDTLHEIAQTVPLAKLPQAAAQPSAEEGSPSTPPQISPSEPTTSAGATETTVGDSLISDLLTCIKPEDYLDVIRPDFTNALHEILFDVDFDTAVADQVSGTRFGKRVTAIDMLGGFGSTLFGHNHPALVDVMHGALAANRPQFVQMSNRSAAGTFAKELVRRVYAETGYDYKAILGSTGGEMVDAALKHALFEWSQRRDAHLSQSRNAGCDATNTSAELPVILAIEGSYHGKTLGAYSLTWNAPGRDTLGLNDPFEVVWIPRDDATAAAEIFARYSETSATSDGDHSFSRIAGVFVEPIQGEGGIFPLDTAFCSTLRELADTAACPLILDEIQSGMGRTGSFTAASRIGLRGDYYIFSKSLGGGLVKTAALLIDSTRYATGYGFAHTSTFAEDDHGALVGLRALQLLDEDKIEERARDAGDYLVQQLQGVMTRYPDVIADVRGVGLMVGIEVEDQSINRSQVIAGLAEQKLLGLFIASHLLHRQGVRVGTALSRPMTLRLEPSAYISRADMDKTVAGIESACRTISEANGAELLRHLAQAYRRDVDSPFRMSANRIEQSPADAKTSNATTSKRAVFLGHMINSDDIGFWDQSLLTLSQDERNQLTSRMPDPIVVKQMPLVSGTEDTLEFELQSLPITSQSIIDALREGKSNRIVEQVNTAIAEFARQGASVVGLGGLLSVIMRNGLSVRNEFDDLQITTGNTYTVALAAEAVVQTAREKQIDPKVDRIGVVGAGGNIGSTLVHVLSEEFQNFHLAGRKQSIARVEQVADAVYDAALASIKSSDPETLTGLAAALAGVMDELQIAPDARHACANGEDRSPGARLRQRVIAHHGSDPFLPVSTSIEALQDCSVIVTASNAVAPILNESNVGSNTRVICDISVPSDVDPSLIDSRPDIAMVRGGVARLPDGNTFTLDMIGLPEGHLLACMAETALLGLANGSSFQTIGDIDAASVKACHELGQRHGFELSYTSVEKPFSIDLA